MTEPRRVLITGGVKRLGLAMALAFAKRSARLALNYHTSSPEEAENTRKQTQEAGAVQVELIPGDITTNASGIVETAVTQLGGIDVLINNASIFPPRRPLSGLSIQDFQQTLGLNLLAPFQMTQAALPHLGEGSSVINLASLGGFQIWKERIDYNVSKSALITLTKALARELAPQGVRVNAIAPGAIQVDEDEKMGVGLDKIPLGYYGKSEDIAQAALYLVYDAPYVTGQVLVIDGGRSLT